jgi:hypothetical protein
MIYYKFDRERGIPFLEHITPSRYLDSWLRLLYDDVSFNSIQIRVDHDKIGDIYFGEYDTGKYFDVGIRYCIISLPIGESFRELAREWNMIKIGI